MKLYLDDDQFVAGITLKNDRHPECNNMALHVCTNPQNILHNRKAVAAKLGVTLQNFVCAEQTHSNNFYKVSHIDKGRGVFFMDTAIPHTDALYTYESGIVLTSFSADCVPILLCNQETGVIAAIHSGWQGTVKEVLPKLLHQLITVENNPAHAFYVYINPALSQQKFEVDQDVYDKFLLLGYADDYIYFNDLTNKYHIDNQLTVKKQCELANIPSENIHIDRTCTYLNTCGFSYRENKHAGRHMSFIYKK